MAIRGIDDFSGSEILQSARKDRGITQVVLAERLGITQGTLSALLSRPHPSLNGFVKVLDAMDYEVAVIDRKTGENKWTVGIDE